MRDTGAIGLVDYRAPSVIQRNVARRSLTDNLKHCNPRAPITGVSLILPQAESTPNSTPSYNPSTSGPLGRSCQGDESQSTNPKTEHSDNSDNYLNNLNLEIKLEENLDRTVFGDDRVGNGVFVFHLQNDELVVEQNS